MTGSDESRDDTALLARARDGDRSAVEALFRRYEPMLQAWARRRLGFPLRTLEETQDILQEVYLVVLQKVAEFEPQDQHSFPAWLKGIATRIVLQKASGSYLRHRLLDPEPLVLRDLEATPCTAATLDEIKRRTYQELRGFDRLDRLIYRLRRRGFSSTQIADLVGMTDRGVRMRHARVDARLRLRLGRLADGDPEE
ncbi:MAG: sigma-70 family RNA polymerase sigma factor [Planctomycetes bacterium]|nr:sigma-70 family RNA polymerase sigma factor [Planctomycetota bacterium]